MKLLDNPWVVGGLCVVAVVVAGYRLLLPRDGGSFAPASAAPSLPSDAPAAPSRNPQPASTAARTAAPPSLIDRGYVQSRLPQWIEAPQRDPFLRATAAEHGVAATSPVSQWKLKAIWHQTGSRLAVINKGVYAERDLIEGYQLETIESDGVWLRGPTGREGLGFARPEPAIAALIRTNSTGR